MASNRNFYDVLGVSKTATAAEIKSAYRKMALQFHPDRNKEKDAESKFKEINEAYEVLSDEKKRQTYDQYGHAAFTQGNMGSAQGNPYAGGFGQQGPFSYSYTGRGGQNPFDGYDFGGFSDPFDIFESFFGGGFSRQARKPLYELEIDFMDAVNGATKEVAIDGKKRTIKIPPGADSGTRIRYQEFDVRVLVRAHAQFKREADDIHVDLPVPFYRAILGGEISVPTLDGSLTLKLRPGTQPNSMIRLREYGVTHLSGRGKGDQYVRIVITMPEKLSKEERKALEVFES